MKDIFNRIEPRVILSLSGVLLGLAVIFPEIGLLAYVALIPLALVIYERARDGKYLKMKCAYRDGFVFFMSYGIVVFHWFVYFYPLDFTGMSKLEALGIVVLAWLGVPLVQALFSAALFALIAVFLKSRVYQKHPMSLPLFLSALFVINEWTQTLTWAGVPWGRIGISQTEMPVMIQPAALFGTYIITFTVVLFNFLCAYAIFYADKRKRASVSALVLLGCYVLCGAALYFIPTKDDDRYVKVASVQGNLLSQTHYDMGVDEIYDIYERLSLEAIEDGADIILWPENVFGTDMDAVFRLHSEKYVRIKNAISMLAEETGATFVVGGYVFSEDDEDVLYNSLSVFYPDGESVINAYAKMKLVPFGEFVPMRSLVESFFPQLSEISMLPIDNTAGQEHKTIQTSNDGTGIEIGPLICFDSVYENVAAGSAEAGAEFFFIPSNDSWFYNSRALNMHHAQNILRAVEQGKYTVSSGNTGITSVVTDKGTVVSEMPIYKEGYIVETVYANSTRTLYSHIGNAFVYLCIALTALVFVPDIVAKLKNKKRTEALK